MNLKKGKKKIQAMCLTGGEKVAIMLLHTLAEGIRTDLITLGPFSATHMACIVGKVSKLILILHWSVQCR